MYSGRVHRAKTHAAIQTAERNRRARLDVLAVLDSAHQVMRDQPNAFDRIVVDDRMREAVCVRLHAVCERIDAGGRGHGRRHRDREERIHVSRVRHEVRAHDTFLQIVRFVEQDGDRRNFAARARSGRQAHEIRVPADEVADAERVVNRLRAVEKGGDELGDIHRAAAADADDGVGLRATRNGERGIEIANRGLLTRLGPYGHFASAMTNFADQRRRHVEERWRGHEEHGSRLARGQRARALLGAPCTEGERAHLMQRERAQPTRTCDGLAPFDHVFPGPTSN